MLKAFMPFNRGNITIILGVSCIAILAFALYSTNRSITLPTGTVFKLEGIVANEKPILFGTMPQKVFNEWIPPQGLELFGYKLTRPSNSRHFDADGDFLVIWLSCTNADFQQPSGPLYNFRANAIANDGTEYENESPFLHQLHQTNSTVFLSFKLSAFPRDQHYFKFQLLVKDGGAEWNRSSTISVRNPFFTTRQEWRAMPLPITNQAGNIECVLHRVESGVELSKEASSQSGVQVYISSRLTSGNFPDWHISKCVGYDSLRNFQKFYRLGVDKTGFERFVAPFSLNPFEVWRIELVLTPSEPNRKPDDTAEFLYSGTERRMVGNSKVFGVPVEMVINGSQIEVSLPTSPREIDISNIYRKAGFEGEVEVGSRSRDHMWSFLTKFPTNSIIRVGLQKRVILEYFVKPTVIGGKAATSGIPTR